MKNNHSALIRTASEILMNSGVEKLTIPNLAARDAEVKNAIVRIKQNAENYLLKILEEGKAKGIFIMREPTVKLARKILNGFRELMKDEQQLKNLLLEYKTITKNNDEQ